MMEMAEGNEILEQLLAADLARALNALRQGRGGLAPERLGRAAQKI